MTDRPRATAAGGWTIRCALSSLLACAAAAGAASQTSPPSTAGDLLRQPARLEIRGAPLLSALERLRLRSGVALAFSPGLLAGASGGRVILRREARTASGAPTARTGAARPRTGVLVIEALSAQDSQPVAGAEVAVAETRAAAGLPSDGPARVAAHAARPGAAGAGQPQGEPPAGGGLGPARPLPV